MEFFHMTILQDLLFTINQFTFNFHIYFNKSILTKSVYTFKNNCQFKTTKMYSRETLNSLFTLQSYYFEKQFAEQ